MKEFFKNAFVFMRQNPAILYSVAVIVLLPLSLYLDTFFIVQRFQSIIDDNITLQSSSIRDILSPLLARDFSQPGIMQATIDKIAGSGNGSAQDGSGAAATSVPDLVDENQGIKNIRVIVREEGKFKAIAAQNHGDVGKLINTDVTFNGEGLIAYAWSQTKYTAGYVVEGNRRYWRIIDPLVVGASKEPYALVVADIPLDGIDRSISDTVWLAFGITSVIILIALALVVQHTRLLSYVSLSKRLQEQIIAKDNFIRMATHELRSPVTVIMAYMEALKDELAAVANDEQKQYIDRISISIKNLNDLMSDILEVSHLQQGRTDFKPEKLAADVVVKEIVDGIVQKAQAKGLALTFESEKQVAMLGDDKSADLSISINVNPVCFKRIITNLVENSVKYTPAGKVMVSVKTERAKKRCVITVQDTGFGISAEGQNRLFEQFYRVKTEENAGIPGTGLGLWMSREMARKMGGDIMLESIERMGSRFFVFFPLANK